MLRTVSALASEAAPGAALSYLPPACQACIEENGLCASCARGDRSILPQLRQPSWHRDALRGVHYIDKGAKPSPEAQRLQARRERRRARRMEELKAACGGGLLSTAAA